MSSRNVTLTPSRTVVSSFSTRIASTGSAEEAYEEGVWVLFVEARLDTKWLSCALSSGDVHLYDKERLQLIHSYPKVHDSIITDLSCGGPKLLSSSGKDGGVCLFDVRQPALACKFSLLRKDEEALSVALGYDGVLAAVGGSKAHIHFHDLRNAGAFFGSYQDSHTEEVIRVRFQSQVGTNGTTPLLVSASEDGLACTFDTSKPSEEAALRSVLNVETPLREVGFFGPAYEGVYCLTGSETMSVWHHDSAQRICDFGTDLRDKLSRVAGGLSIDYLVDCSWDEQRQQLELLAGNHFGASALYRVEPDVLSLSHTLRGGHQGDVRSWCRASSSILVTAGEDARLCEWNRTSSLESQGGDALHRRKEEGVLSQGGGPVRRDKKNRRETPY
jgi:WD40 repeat protein